ncbi:tetratricopeptide repeat protein [Pelagibius litoralis]|uniref:Tetratricopeptide repeat protein n=1 Tax=Pelagibius litoralis TaxID=374515 RepID=A0A967KGF9_9PROT|nr:tetratricopeptide repeat protein [Pelagibius litoralis]NIA70321.1 tetratricopeptide repeat protein [Pelagibius litoralis]
MADIFKEVEEDLRRDKAADWWKRYSLYIYVAAAVVILSTAGYQGWRTYDQKLRGEQSDSYAAALAMIEEGNEAEGRRALKALSDPSGSGYPLLAALTEARLAAEAGEDVAAAETWGDLAADGSAIPAITALGDLYAVMQEMDEGDPVTLRSRLEVLAAVNAPYRFTALELLAALALREGDQDMARQHLSSITDDPNAPAGSRARAAELLSTLPG